MINCSLLKQAKLERDWMNKYPLITIGTIEFVVPRRNLNNIGGEIPFHNMFRKLAPRHYEAIKRIHHAILGAASAPLGSTDTVIFGGTVSNGSLIFRDGKFLVRSKALAAALVGYLAIQGYPDFRTGLIALATDIQTAIKAVETVLNVRDINFVLGDLEPLRNELIHIFPDKALLFRRHDDEEDNINKLLG